MRSAIASTAERREGIVDTYAPWLYRLVDSELSREGKIDGTQTLPMTPLHCSSTSTLRMSRLGRRDLRLRRCGAAASCCAP